MKNEKILNALGKINDDMIADARIGTPAKKSTPKWVRWVAMAACLCLIVAASSLIAPLFGGESGDKTTSINPLVITVYAESLDGTTVPVALKLGEKVKMHPTSHAQLEDFDGYAINLTLFEAKYVHLRAVDKNWETIRFPTDEIYADTKLEYNWAATEGDDIWVVHLDAEGKVIPPEADNLLIPKLKGSDFIWRPNDADMNRAIIGVYDEAYNLLATYYLEVTEESGDYYAEVVKIEN